MTDEQILQWTREAGFPPLSKDYLLLYRKEIQEWLQRMHAFAHLAYEQGRKDGERGLRAENAKLREIAKLVLHAVKNRQDKDWALMHLDLSEAAERARAVLAKHKEQAK